MNQKSCLSKLTDVMMGIQFNSIPNAVVEKAMVCLADYIGIFCAGKQKEEALRLYQTLGGKALEQDIENLSFWMGGASRLLDLDDGHRFAMGHPGVVINATAIACNSCFQTSGKTLIEAIVRGYEVYCYQGRLVNPSAYLKRGFDATCICGAAGAAAVAGTIMGLDRQQMKDAISLAASLCGGLNQYAVDGGAPKYLCAGWAAKLGIASAKLAKGGMGGPEYIFEGRLGYANGFSPEPNQEFLKEVNLNWEIDKVYLKKYSCVRRIHPTLDVIEKLFAQEQISEEKVEKVMVYGGQFICDAAIYNPKDIVKAQTSIPYTVALLMKHGLVTAELVDNSLDDPEIEKLAQKVEIIYDTSFTELTKKEPSLWGASRVKIRMLDGSIYQGGENIALGDPENPFSKEALRSKFIGLVSDTFDGDVQKGGTLWDELNSIAKSDRVFNVLKAVNTFD